MDRDRRAPIFTAAWDLCAWLLKKTKAQPHEALSQALSQEALRLLDAITLALKNIERDEALRETDLILIRLRLRLRLAMESELLDERQGQYALEQTDAIGRQLGGWQKSRNVAD
jgi:hypothetical protein